MTSPEEWAEFERLKEFLANYDLLDILAVASEKAFEEAQNLKGLGYQDSGAELERLSDILGCLHIPTIPTAQNRGKPA